MYENEIVVAMNRLPYVNQPSWCTGQRWSVKQWDILHSVKIDCAMKTNLVMYCVYETYETDYL